MSCSYFTHLGDLLAGRLAEPDRLMLEEHLARCTLCEQELLRLTDDDEERRWREVLREAGAVKDANSEQNSELDPPEAFLTRLRTELGPPASVLDDRPSLPSAPDKGAGCDSTTTPRPDSPLTVTAGEGAALSVRSPVEVFSGPPRSPRPRRLGAYWVLRELGHGGMGVVYLARDERLKRLVAVKMMWPTTLDRAEERRRFVREAEVVARLKHPNIVQIYEVSEHDGAPYLVMELVEGPSLRDRIHATPQPVREAASLVRILALAMHHAHQNGVIHRDLKPANILLARARVGIGEGSESPSTTHDSPLTSYQPKITDFGLARQLDVPADISFGGQIIGTPSYMAPEQAGPHALHTSVTEEGAKAPAVGPATDIYGLGAILYELLTGRPPFQGLDPLHTLLQVRHHEPVPPSRLQPKVSRDLETICLKCLDKQPLRRYANAEALAAELERFLKGEPIRARPVGTAERLWRWCRRNPLVASLSVLVAMLLLIATAAGVVVAYHQTQLAAELRAKNLALEEANLRESAARAEAERSAVDAQAKFTLARKAVDDLLHTLAEDLWATQDIPRVRQKMLQEALTIYQQFLEEKGNDPTVRQRTAEAYHQVGVIQSELGQPAPAEASARQAIAIAEKLVADFPTIAAYRHDLATYHTALSASYRNQQRQPEAEAAVRQALRLREALVGSHPAYLSNRQRLGASYQALGTVLWDQQKWVEAEAAFRQAVAADELLLHEGNDLHDPRVELATSCNKLGMMLGSRGRLHEADGYLRRAASLLQHGAEAFPDAPHVQHLWAEALYNRGGVAVSRKDFAEAVQVLRQALSINEKLVADFPTWPAYATTLAGGYCSLGHCLRGQNQWEAALQWYARAIQTAEQVLARDARQTDAVRFLNLAYLGRAQALEQLGRDAEAAQAWERMLARYSGPDRWHYRLLEARSLARAGDPEKAVALADELASDNKLSPTAFYNLACVYALSATAVEKDARLADRYAARAVVLLRQAGEAVSAKQVLGDGDLDSLRRRADFRAFMEERERQP